MAITLARPEVSQYVEGNVAGVLYGMLLVLASMSFYILIRGIIREPTSRRVNTFLFISLMIITGMITAVYVIDSTRTATALLEMPTISGQAKYLTDLEVPNYAQVSGLLTSVVLVGDIVLAWRCWAIWRDLRVVILPVALIIGSFVSGYIGIDRIHNARPNDVIYVASIKAWGHAFVACSLAANIYTTSFIAGRLWYLDRQAHQFLGHTGGAIRRAAVIVVESGALNAAAMLSYEVALGVKSNVFHIFSAYALYSVGISFSLIVIRVAQHGSSAADYQRSVTNTHMSFVRPSTARSTRQQNVDNAEKGQGEGSVNVVPFGEQAGGGSTDDDPDFNRGEVPMR